MILTRTENRFDGIFGTLTEDDDTFIAVTLEHAFEAPSHRVAAVIPQGRYTCIRGLHRLEGMKSDFETFEIMNVPLHKGLLFHVGNYNRDTKGCILLGSKIFRAQGGLQMILNSEKTFEQFMKNLGRKKSFSLDVIG